jgi:hypothetical protein
MTKHPHVEDLKVANKFHNNPIEFGEWQAPQHATLLSCMIEENGRFTRKFQTQTTLTQQLETHDKAL